MVWYRGCGWGGGMKNVIIGIYLEFLCVENYFELYVDFII